MSNSLKFFLFVLMCTYVAVAQRPSADQTAKAVVLQKDQGEVRTRRPRLGVNSPTRDFLLKVGPRSNGSKHLLLGTEEIPPGGVIPKHKHHHEDEILLIETGNAHVWLGDQEYDARPGALVFIPAGTWISLMNTGKENIRLIFVWNEPSFEAMMLCASVPKGQAAPAMGREEVEQCYQQGDGELDVAQASSQQKR